MSEHQQIAGICPGDQVRSVYFVSSAARSESKNGPYWRLELRDATGSAEAKIWSPLSQRFQTISQGAAVEVTGKSGVYRDQMQITVDDMRLLSDEETAALDPSEYMPSSARSSEEMMDELEALCGSVLTHAPWRALMQSVLGDGDIRRGFMRAAGAKSVHHAYAGGLLEHSLSVAKLCMAIAGLYPELDRQLLLAAAVLHDIGKLEEMSGTLNTEYTGEGRMMGHLLQGLIMLEPFIIRSGLERELAVHFRHLIASHHGQADFGAIRDPLTIEAFVLHHADDIDAKAAYFRANLPAREDSPGSYWAYMPLYRHDLCRPMHTPEPDIPEEGLPGHSGLAADSAGTDAALEFRLDREVMAREALERELSAERAEKKALEQELRRLRKSRKSGPAVVQADMMSMLRGKAEPASPAEDSEGLIF